MDATSQHHTHAPGDVPDAGTDSHTALADSHTALADAHEPGTGHRPAAPNPVTDWATDFDHADPAYNQQAPAIWDELRQRCPVAHTERYGGAWLPTRYEDIRAIVYDTDHFSSNGVVVSNVRPRDEERPAGGAPPITADPPFHTIARRLLLPAFAPKVIEAWEPEIRRLCRELIEGIDARPGDSFDAAVEYAQNIPVHVIATMLGFPRQDAELFRGFVHDVLEAVDVSEEERTAAFDRLGNYVSSQIDEHVANPQDNLTGHLMAIEIDGTPLPRHLVAGMIILLLIAGIDTTWSAIGSTIWHLAQHPAHRERLITEPELMPTAMEEFLRAYAPVTMARFVVEDAEIGGCPVKAGDWVLLPFPAANRDPELFDRPDEVILDREQNRHAAFGLGIHRCIGSNLARLELRVAIEEFLAAYPRFTLTDPTRVTWSVGQVRGPRSVPVTLTP